MNLRCTFSAAALVAASAFSHHASASLMIEANYNGLSGQTVQVSHNSVNSSVQAGLMQFNLHANTDLSILPFDVIGMSVDAFCVEFTQGVLSGWQSYELVETSQVFSATQSQAIERLFTAYHTEVGTASSNNAAFQLALWEIVHETAPSWDLTQGSFTTSTNGAVLDLASGWLQSLDSIESQFSLYVLTNANSQNQLVFSGVPLDTPTSVPAPATLGLFGLGALLLLRRRKSS
ncbi:PEP-CTERM sorting domain-containing protein [Alkalimonas delamerensis]|uniref:PEP-CTERM sorting domain-containing protein n=1 Tax=Alkalimonas delamerensis TaxID=265981 RepID=A0ABT9GNH6_9GAMM|nr:PEP-CTERM sorting domain-containing protein [Alkalimonas delamerensis]MDP4528523.1 PEP-CTERM sorting domain-containing protein [Alkalimonas delamerensis]